MFSAQPEFDDIKNTDFFDLSNIEPKIGRYGETDLRAFQFAGELQVANGGLIEYIKTPE